MSIEDRLNNIELCTRCSQCKFVYMPKSKDFSSACPTKYHSRFHASSGGGQVISAYGYHKGALEASPKMIDSVFSCTMCGACDTMCKSHMGDNVEPFDTLLEFRAQLVEDGKVPQKIIELVQNLEQEGSPLGLRSQRTQCLEGLTAQGVEIKDARKQAVEVLLHIGSSYAYDKSQWNNLHFLVKLLNAADVDFGIAYDDESDSGSFAYEVGFKSVAEKLAGDWQQLLQQSKASTVLTLSAEAYAGFKNIYPRLNQPLDQVTVLHMSEFIEHLLSSGRLALSLKGSGKVAYHDSCRLGRRSENYKPWSGERLRVLNTLSVTDSPREVNFGNEGNYDAPRHLLSRVTGLELLELERAREFSFCCGAGAGVKESYPHVADGAAQELLREAQAVGADIFVTASACCEANMTEAAEKSNSPVQVRNLFTLLAESIEGNAEAAEEKRS